jgi:hypothetical protein
MMPRATKLKGKKPREATTMSTSSASLRLPLVRDRIEAMGDRKIEATVDLSTIVEASIVEASIVEEEDEEDR